MPDDRTRVTMGKDMPEQDLRVPLKTALLQLDRNLKAECEARDVSYNAASKALSGQYPIVNCYVRDLFQRILHMANPHTYEPAPGQTDLAADRTIENGEVTQL